MSQLPPAYLNAVVALEHMPDEQDGQHQPMGSGVLLGQGSAEGYHVYLATNRHVVDGQDSLWVKMNSEGGAHHFELGLTEGDYDLWFGYGDFDVAVTYVSGDFLLSGAVEFDFIAQEQWLTLEGMEREGLTAGTELFVLGFPLGLAGNERKYSIVRSGMIARLDEEIVAESNAFLIDSPVYPGNSGGPVFEKPAAVVVSESPPAGPRFLGLVSNYLPYIDTAFSIQTGKPRVSFEENSGLASVVPVDAILGAIKNHEATAAIVEAETAKQEGEGAGEDGMGDIQGRADVGPDGEDEPRAARLRPFTPPPGTDS